MEGIAPEEMKVYEHCFAAAGAVQCGFCIPGMVISAKSLLDFNLNPTRTDMKQAIKGNLCRCNGYKKIEDAIIMAADFFREKKEIPPAPSSLQVVASRRKETLEEICSLVETDYTELSPVTTPFDALKGDAPLIHEDGNVMSRANLVRGNADEAISQSKYVVTRKYKTSWQEHGFMEPECCVAMPEGEDGLLIYTSCQMGIGYGVTEKFECEDGYPKSRFGTIGFMKASEAPELSVILCEPEEKDKLPYSLGAKGCGELCMIPTAPACTHAYYRLDGVFRQSLPLEHTPYRK